MAILIAVLVYVLALFAAAFYGCLGWFFPKSLVIIALALGAWAAWSLATLTTGAGGRVTTWWTTNRDRLIRAAIIFAILATLILLVWYTKSSWAPPCAGVTAPTTDCPGTEGTTPVTPITPVPAAAATPAAPVTALVPIRSMDVVVTKEFSNDIPVPPGQMVLWESVEGVPFDILTPSGSTYPQPRRPANDTRTPCERMVWISEAASSFKVRIQQDAPETSMTFRIVYYPYRAGGPCA